MSHLPDSQIVDCMDASRIKRGECACLWKTVEHWGTRARFAQYLMAYELIVEELIQLSAYKELN